MSEQQRVAIVTGAAGGIGRELVLGLLGNGLKVAAVDRTAQGLAELAQAVQERQQGANLMTIEADLARDESIDEIVSEARGRFGAIDILVNNAGVGQATVRSDNRQRPIKFWEVTPEQWKLFVAVHTNAPMALSRARVHDMMRQKWGRIVNVTTSLGTMIREGAPTYGPSKAALEAFSAIMAKDLAGTGITVNVLVPGGVTNTGMVPLEAGYNRIEMIQPAVKAPPLNWLVSDAAGGVTGRRFLAVHWDPSLPPEEAAAKAGAPVAWTEIVTMPIEPPRRNQQRPTTIARSAFSRWRDSPAQSVRWRREVQADLLSCRRQEKAQEVRGWSRQVGNTIFSAKHQFASDVVEHLGRDLPQGVLCSPAPARDVGSLPRI